MCYRTRRWVQLCKSIWSIFRFSSYTLEDVEEEMEDDTAFENIDELPTFESKETIINDDLI